MKLRKSLALVAIATGLSATAAASTINVGGVMWDPQAVYSLPGLADFASYGSIFETVAINPGEMVTGQGKVERINSAINNEGSFCPGCELTFTFSMELVSFTGTPNGSLGGTDGDFVFKDLNIKFWVDKSPDYDGSNASAADGNLWLELVLNPANFLTGTGTALGSGSDQGNGGGVLDAVDGMALANFDTNAQAGGGDLTLTSSFQPVQGAPGLLSGTFDLTGNSIPEPMTLSVLGLGLLGLSRFSRKK